MIEDMVESLAEEHGVDADIIWEDFESVDDDELLETAAWRRSAGKNKNGGLNAKGVASYRRENPGSKLQMAVTTKPSKLKPGSKSAKRRKSFCARMSGVEGPMKKPNGKPTRKALALKKWNCQIKITEIVAKTDNVPANIKQSDIGLHTFGNAEENKLGLYTQVKTHYTISLFGTKLPSTQNC